MKLFRPSRWLLPLLLTPLCLQSALKANDCDSSLRVVGTKAAVIGGSISGTLTAAALAPFFESVLIIERDELSSNPHPRKNVPQARHSHALTSRGAKSISKLMGGLDVSKLQGVLPVNMTTELEWNFWGEQRPKIPSPLYQYWCDRARMECELRLHLAEQHSNVSWVHADVMNLHRKNSSWELEVKEVDPIYADYVVDASGGARSRRWVESLTGSKVPVSELTVEVTNASRLYRIPPNFQADWKALAIFPKPPHNPRAGTLYAIDDNTWMVSLSGIKSINPKTKAPYETGFLEFARQLESSQIYELIKDAEPLGRIHFHRFQASRQSHFERVSDWPSQFNVLGDAVCRFNPRYGQGMSVCALQAELLHAELSRLVQSSNPHLPNDFSQRLQKRFSKIVQPAWTTAMIEDLRYPEVAGRRSLLIQALQWYTQRYIQISSRNPEMHLRFVEVIALEKPPSQLLTWRALLPE